MRLWELLHWDGPVWQPDWGSPMAVAQSFWAAISLLFKQAIKMLRWVKRLSVELEQSESYLVLPLEWVGDFQRPGRMGFHHSFSSEKKIIWEWRAGVSQPFSRNSLWKGNGIQAPLGWKIRLSNKILLLILTEGKCEYAATLQSTSWTGHLKFKIWGGRKTQESLSCLTDIQAMCWLSSKLFNAP